MADRVDIETALNQISASLVALRADHTALLSLVEAVGRCAGLESVDGLSSVDYFNKQRRVELERAMISLEDADPGLAAMIQEQLDKLED